MLTDLRELQEECGLVCQENNLTKCGALEFSWLDEPEMSFVHVFKADDYKGEIIETEGNKRQIGTPFCDGLTVYAFNYNNLYFHVSKSHVIWLSFQLRITHLSVLTLFTSNYIPVIAKFEHIGLSFF